MTKNEFKSIVPKEWWMNEQLHEQIVDEMIKGLGGLDAFENLIEKGAKHGMSRDEQLALFKDLLGNKLEGEDDDDEDSD